MAAAVPVLRAATPLASRRASAGPAAASHLAHAPVASITPMPIHMPTLLAAHVVPITAIAPLAPGQRRKVVARKAKVMAIAHTAIRPPATLAGQAKAPVKARAEIAHKALAAHRVGVTAVHKVAAVDRRVTADRPVAAPPAAAAIAPAIAEQSSGAQPDQVPT